MKKYLFLLALPLLMTSCAKEPAEALSSLPIDFSNTTSTSNGSSLESSEAEPTYQWVKLTPENSGLTNDDSTSSKLVTLNSEIDSSIEYSIEIGAPCYLHSKFHEFVVKPGAYIRSLSDEYTVDRLIVDFYSSKGINFDVYSNSEGTGTALEYHTSDVKPEDSADGTVYEYAINGNNWCIKNNTEFNKPAFYSIIVVFLA